MSKRLIIVGVLSVFVGVGALAVSLTINLAGIIATILQAVGALLILVGVILIGWQVCSDNHEGQKSSRKKVLKTKNRSQHVREISRSNYGQDNYGGPQYNGGLSVISANNLHQDHRGLVQSTHHAGGRSTQYSHSGGVQYNQGGGGVQYSQGGGVHFNPSGVRHAGMTTGGVNNGYRGSMDSINSINSYNSYNSNTLSFDSDLSVGSLQSGPPRSSMRAKKDTTSLSSNTSKKSTRFAIGGEQTAV